MADKTVTMTYNGAHRAVEVATLNPVRVPRGVAVEVPEALAKRLMENGTWSMGIVQEEEANDSRTQSEETTP